MAWSDTEVEEIVESMRAGATVMSGGSRCHTTYGFRNGAWWLENFDEGYTDEHTFSEAGLRSMIASDPELFRGVLADPRWRRFGAAFVAEDRDPVAARKLLDEALVYGDRLDRGPIYAAILAWPGEPPSAQATALIEQKVGDYTAYHVFMEPAGWERNAVNGRKGVAYVDQLREMVGDVVGIFALRATFHGFAGDREAAARDLVLELERAPIDDWRHAGWQQSLDQVRGAMLGSLE